jgi:hypothetical protein
LRRQQPLAAADLAAAEQEVIDRVFAGSRPAYLEGLKRRAATRDMALGILEDELRREQLAAVAAAEPGKTALLLATETGAGDIATATCRRDLLPGRGNFPASDVRVVGVVPLAAKLLFLRDDHEAPAASTELTATTGADGAVTLDWLDGTEPDLAGYVVYRGAAPGGPYTRITPTLLPYSTYADRTPPADGGTPVYVVRSMDTSGNLSTPSPEATPAPAAQ